MPPNERDNSLAVSDLAKVLAEIKECEDFVAVCDRIKTLEKLEESNVFPQKIAKLQTHIAETTQEMKVAAENVNRNENVLHHPNRTIGSDELEQLKEQIKASKARVSTLQLHREETQSQIKRFQAEMQRNSKMLEQLYAVLEDAMKFGGFHPNTINQRIEELRGQEAKLRAERKANIALRNTERENLSKASGAAAGDNLPRANDWIDPRSKANLKEPAIQESNFLERFMEDVRSAKKSVIIVSKYLSVEQSGKIMPELAKLAGRRLNVLIYTTPPEEHSEAHKLESLSVIAVAHRHMITVILRSDIANNAAIIDDLIAWEGSLNILGPPRADATMHRVVGSSNARALRKYISAKPV